jgi:hypothetical protein
MHILQGVAQGRQAGIGQHRGGQPVLCAGGVRLVERHTDEQAQPRLGHSFGPGINRRQMILGRTLGMRIDPPIFRVHDFQARGTATRLAEAANARAARETVLLLRGEMEKTQSQKAGAVADFAQHLPPAAKYDLGEQDLALHRAALSGAKLSQRHHARAIFVTQGQEKQEVLGGLHAQGEQPQRERIADAAQHRDRLKADQ